MKQGSSGLTVRECQVRPKNAFDLSPKNVNKWVKNLPIANLGESAQSTYRLLIDANQSIIEPDKRMAMLNLIDPVVQQLTIGMEKQFIKNHISLTEKQKKIAAILQAIETEIAIGFHSVIESIVDSGNKRVDKKLLALALVMSIKYHGSVILRCFELYTTIPSRLWRELYSLYQIAIDYELDRQSVNIENTKESTNAHNCFTRILLLSVANPYQLRQQEIQILWRVLTELTDHVSLDPHASSDQHYLVALNSSLPPIHKSLYQGKESGLKLTTNTAVEQLKMMLESITDLGQNNVRKSMMLRHLIQCWSHGTHRSFARTPCNEVLDISIGLGASHYLMMNTLAKKAEADEESKQAENEEEEQYTQSLEKMEGSLLDATLIDTVVKDRQNPDKNINYLSSSEMPDEDAWAKLYRPAQLNKASDNSSLFKNRSRDKIVQESYKLQEVDLINMSPGGYCIQIASEELPKHAQTGEILGFLEEDTLSQEQWSVGVVRWVRRQVKGSIVQMGVQLLAPAAIPIDIQLRNSNNANEFQRALMLPALTGVGQPATLLTNPISFQSHSKVRLIEQGQTYDARLITETASSSSFKQFQFEKLESNNDSPAKPLATKSSSFDTPNLDGIWDLI